MHFEGQLTLPSSKFKAVVRELIDELCTLPKDIRWPVSKILASAMKSGEATDRETCKARVFSVIETVTEKHPKLAAYRDSAFFVAEDALQKIAAMPIKVQYAVAVRYSMQELVKGRLPDGRPEPRIAFVTGNKTH